MFFNDDDGRPNERVLYQTKPNMILGCKNAIIGVIILMIILSLSSIAIKFIGQMQVYLISYVKLPLTSYMAIAFFVIILVNVIYIIWQLMNWYSIEYTLTDTKIIVKSGVISSNKSYMPYSTIQDLNTSQNILEKIFNVGTVFIFSAYDNNLLELKNISGPSEVEEIIFSRMVGPRNFQAPPQGFPPHEPYDRFPQNEPYDRFPQNEPYDRFPQNESFDRAYPQEDDYLGRNDYYDEFEPITPITHEKNYPPRREYEYYPENFPANESPRHKYDYEPYDAGYNNRSNRRSQDNYYNQVRDDYSYRQDNRYQNSEPDVYYEEVIEEPPQNEATDMSQKAIQRHFDKFKK